MNTDSRDEPWTPKAGAGHHKLTPSVSLFANYPNVYTNQRSFASRDDAPTSQCHEVGLNLTCSMALPPTSRCFDIHKRNGLYNASVGVKPSPKPLAAYARRVMEVDLAGSLTENTNIIATWLH